MDGRRQQSDVPAVNIGAAGRAGAARASASASARVATQQQIHADHSLRFLPGAPRHCNSLGDLLFNQVVQCAICCSSVAEGHVKLRIDSDPEVFVRIRGLIGRWSPLSTQYCSRQPEVKTGVYCSISRFNCKSQGLQIQCWECGDNTKGCTWLSHFKRRKRGRRRAMIPILVTCSGIVCGT